MCATRYIGFVLPLVVAAVGFAAEPIASPSQRLEEMRRAGVKVASTKCKAPQKVHSRIVTNRHSDDKDREVTTTCDGRQVTIYKVSKDPSVSNLTRLVIDKKQTGLPFGLNVGSSQDNVENTLGTPSEKAPKFLRYYVYYPTGDDEIRFYVREGMVKRIEWQWNID